MRANQTPTSAIIETNSINDVAKFLSKGSWLVVDLDNTIQQASHELGSDQWFRELCVFAGTLKLDDMNAISMVIAIYHAVQMHVNTIPVEDEAVELINSLQQQDIRVMGLTSRDTVLEETTYRQLNAIGVNLRGNIIFCCGEDKGKCLAKYMNDRKHYPKHVVMAEDLVKHLHSVQAALIPLGINFTGMRYGYLDDKVKQLNMNKAHAQLLQLKPYLQDSTQRMIEVLGIKIDNPHEHPDYIPHFYLDDDHRKPTVTQSMPVLPSQQAGSEEEREHKQHRKFK
jgi:hypothetical protein